MQRNLTSSIGIIAVAMALALLESPAAASVQQASGIFVVEDLVLTSMQPRGETCHIELTATFRLEGTFDGAFTADFRIVHQRPCDEPAPEIFVARGTFTGEVEGASGSFDFIFVGDIDTEGFAEGDLVIGSGAADLAHLSGRITLSGLAGVSGSYAGRIHLVP